MELNRFKQLLESTLGDVKPLITEMNSEDLQSMFETMIDEIGEYVIENSYFGSVTEDDMESFASSVSEFATNKIQEEFPNLKITYVIYYGGALEFSVFDEEEEGIVATYRPNF
jgi:hypothetical protein